MGKEAGWERSEAGTRRWTAHSPLPQDAIDGGLHVVYAARWGCLPLVSEKVWSRLELQKK